MRLAAADAVELAHALAIDVARELGVRALVIKGPSAQAHGLRPDRVCADADVLIAPDDAEAYLATLARCGWHERASAAAFGPKSVHSVTLIHGGWPCDIDAHVEFPGFLAPAPEVFDELWARRQPLAIGGVHVDTVDRSAAILIAALHALRTPAQTQRHAQEIQLLVDQVLPAIGDADREDLVALAVATGAVDTARPVLERLGSKLPSATPRGQDPRLDAWRARVGGRGEMLAQWVPILGRARWWDRPAMVARMIWPTEAQFRAIHPETPAGRDAAWRGRWARVGRGLRAVPRVVWGRMLARRGVTDSSLLHEIRR